MDSTRLTSEELATWRSFIEVTNELRALFGAQLQRDTNLSTGDYSVLLALSEADESLRSSELAAGIDWERSRLSHHLARMERRGLVQRTECLADSRGAEIAITAEGAQVFRRASAPHLKAIKSHFVDALTEQQLAQLAEITSALRAHLHRQPEEGAALGRGSKA